MLRTSGPHNADVSILATWLPSIANIWPPLITLPQDARDIQHRDMIIKRMVFRRCKCRIKTVNRFKQFYQCRMRQTMNLTTWPFVLYHAGISDEHDLIAKPLFRRQKDCFIGQIFACPFGLFADEWFALETGAFPARLVVLSSFFIVSE